jgi:hypothetical protein
LLRRFIQLSGNSVTTTELPQKCVHCECKDFFQQPDFKRSLGLWVVTLASISTFVLLYFRAGWWVTWSPMFFVLVVDRSFAFFSPKVLICYKCETVYRGISSKLLNQFAAFDLEKHDRYQYAETAPIDSD